jgi:surface carbohydrate biosynthesis protein (TIGR04326 family)
MTTPRSARVAAGFPAQPGAAALRADVGAGAACAAVFVTSEPVGSLDPDLLKEYAGVSAVTLGLNGGAGDGVLPTEWPIVEPDDLIEAPTLRERFVGFLDEWPRQAVHRDRSFNEVFRVDGLYSAWWTSIGADRQSTHSIIKYFRYAALVDAAIERWRPDALLLLTSDPLCAALVHSRAARSGIPVRAVPGCVEPATGDVGVSLRWLLRSTRHALTAPIARMILALKCRWALRRAALFRRSDRPIVVFASRWGRNMSLRDGRLVPLNWSEVSRALAAVAPAVEQVYMPRRLDEIVDANGAAGSIRRGLDAVRRADAPLLLWERFFPWRGNVLRVRRQIVMLWRFHALARREDFRRSFRFANTDMAGVLVPDLRDAMERAIDWSFKRAQVARALRAAGNVKAVVVSGEMYRPAMPTLAGAAAAGIPSIGLQHANIMPVHFVYAVPAGHVEHAPVPDYFAAYGEYARETLSVYGAYPAHRVWITGAARLDPLVCRLPDQRTARAELGLPVDGQIVVVGTQTFPWFTSAIRGLLECMRDYPDVLLCFKKHPSPRAMPLAQILAMATEMGVRNIRGFEGQIELLLAASSAWISASSTTTLEATLIGRPTICVNFSGHADRYPYVEEGVSLPARSVDELRRALARVLAPSGMSDCEPRRQAFLRRHVGPTVDGLGAETFARRVVELIGS